MNKINYSEIKKKYIDAAILHRDSSYNGDHKTANKQYKVLKKIYEQIENNILNKEILMDLLNHENTGVKLWAASHMLGLNYEISLAEEELKKITSMSDKGMLGFSAEMTLKVWKQQGYLKF